MGAMDSNSSVPVVHGVSAGAASTYPGAAYSTSTSSDGSRSATVQPASSAALPMFSMSK